MAENFQRSHVLNHSSIKKVSATFGLGFGSMVDSSNLNKLFCVRFKKNIFAYLGIFQKEDAGPVKGQ